MRILVLAICALMFGGLCGPSQAAPTAIPETTRQMVLAKSDEGRYAWKLVRVAVPAVGDHQVLVHVRAVALQHGDLEILDTLSAGSANERDRSGLIVCSDAAGEVAAVGKLVKSVRVGSRVTSLYFGNYLDGKLNPEKQAQGTDTRSMVCLAITSCWKIRGLPRCPPA